MSHPRHLRPAPRRVRPIRAPPATIVQDIRSTKIRSFTPLLDEVSLEDLVPKDHFYRHLEGTLDLSFVRELVAPLYAGGGRPSVDPVVFFKLQLVLFFEDVRSERRLMEVAADRLTIRWFLGYDLHEPLPDCSRRLHICLPLVSVRFVSPTRGSGHGELRNRRRFP